GEISRAPVTMPDLMQKASRASHGVSSAAKMSIFGISVLVANVGLNPNFVGNFVELTGDELAEHAAWRCINHAAKTEITSRTLTPNPSPDQSSVGSSPTKWKLCSKLATSGRTRA